jgi:hypothetical protein
MFILRSYSQRVIQKSAETGLQLTVTRCVSCGAFANGENTRRLAEIGEEDGGNVQDTVNSQAINYKG